MTIETRLRNTGNQGGGGGNSGGLAGTGLYYLMTSADAGLPNSLVIQPGSTVTHHITGSNYYLNAITANAVLTSRTINTTSPLSGGGNLSADRTITLAGLSNQGLAAQIVGVNGAADAWSYHTIVSQLGMDIGTNDAQYLFKVNTSQIFSDIVYPLTGRYYLTTSVDTLLGSSLVIVPGSSVTHHITGSNYYINAITGGGSASSGGLAGTGMFYLMSTAQTAFPNSRQVLAGSSIVVRTDATNFYIDAITSLGASSSGLAGKDAVYILSTYNAEYTNAVYLRPGSSVTTHITGSNMFINAITSALFTSSGLAGKDAIYVLSSFNAEYANAVYIKPGSSVTTHITGSNLFINATTFGAGIYSNLQTRQSPIGAVENVFHCANYRGPEQSLMGTDLVAINSLYAYPFIVTRALSVDFLGAMVSSVSTVSLFRLGIYTNSADGVLYPFTAVVTTSILTSGVVGPKTEGIVHVLSANQVYWFAVNVGTSPVQFKAPQSEIGAQGVYITGLPFSDSTFPKSIYGYKVMNMFSDNLPVTFPTANAGTISVTTRSAPIIGVRIQRLL